MSRTCSICSHAQRADIDAALLAGEPERTIADRFGISKSALHRHRQHIAEAVQAQQALTAARLLRDLAELQVRALALLTKAEKLDDLRAAAQLIGQARGMIATAAGLLTMSDLEARIAALEKAMLEKGGSQ